MSDTERGGGPAFPSAGSFDGMSLRDWFASQAMKVLLESEKCDDYMDASYDAYTIADCMLQARREGWL
jgi:hypothetical protein